VVLGRPVASGIPRADTQLDAASIVFAATGHRAGWGMMVRELDPGREG